MAESIFHADAEAGVTPGCIFAWTVEPRSDSGELNFVNNSGSSPAADNDTQIPAKYVDGTAYVVLLGADASGRLNLRLAIESESSGSEAGPNLTADALQNLGIAFQGSDGTTQWAQLARDLGGEIGTVGEPYQWRRSNFPVRLPDQPHFNGAVWNGECRAVLVDTADPNVDWPTLNFVRLIPDPTKLEFGARAAGRAYTGPAAVGVNATAYTGTAPSDHPVQVLMKGQRTSGRFRGLRWSDRTNEIESIEFSEEGGQTGSGSVSLVVRKPPTAVYNPASPDYFATAVDSAVRGDELELVLNAVVATELINEGDVLTADRLTYNPTADVTTTELRVTGTRRAGGQRYSVFDSEAPVTAHGDAGDVGIRARFGSMSDGDDIYDDGNSGAVTVTMDDGNGGTVTLHEVDAVNDRSGLSLDMGTLHANALANYVVAVRHPESGNEWRALFSEILEETTADVATDRSYLLAIHGDGNIEGYVGRGQEWQVMFLDARHDHIDTETLEFVAGDGDSLLDIPLPLPSNDPNFAGLIGRWEKDATEGASSAVQFVVTDDRRELMTPNGGDYLNDLKLAGDNLIAQFGTRSGSATALAGASDLSIVLRHVDSGYTVVTPITGTGPTHTMAIDGAVAANIRAHDHTDPTFVVAIFDDTWFGVDADTATLNSDHSDYIVVNLLPGLQDASLTNRSLPVLGSQQPRIAYAPLRHETPWALVDGTQFRQVVNYRPAVAGTAHRASPGMVTVDLHSALPFPLVVGDLIYFTEGADPLDGGDPLDLDYAWRVEAISTNRRQLTVAAEVAVATGGSTDDRLAWGTDFLNWTAQVPLYWRRGGGVTDVSVQRAIDRHSIAGGFVVNPTRRVMQGSGALEAVDADLVAYSDLFERRLNIGNVLQSEPDEAVGSYISRVLDKLKAQPNTEPEEFVNRIGLNAGGVIDPSFSDADSGGELTSIRDLLDAVVARGTPGTHWFVDGDRAVRVLNEFADSGLFLTRGDVMRLSVTEDRSRARNRVYTHDSPTTTIVAEDEDDIAERRAIEGGSGVYELLSDSREGVDIGRERAEIHAADTLARYPFLRTLSIGWTEGGERLSLDKRLRILAMRPGNVFWLIVDRPAAPAIRVRTINNHVLYVSPLNAGDALPASFQVGRRLQFSGVTASDGETIRVIDTADGPRGSVSCAAPEGTTFTIGSNPSVRLVERWLLQSKHVDLIPGTAHFREWNITATNTREGEDGTLIQDGWQSQMSRSLAAGGRT